MTRLFQNFDAYPAYRERLHQLAGSADWREVHDAFHRDRFVAVHMLKPTLDRAPEAAFAIGCDLPSQHDWARAHGLKANASSDDILRAQIEAHRTEIFYNHDPMRFGSDFLTSLPGCVRLSLAWRAAPSPGADFGGYDRVLCNFPTILQSYRERGWKPAWFAPAHDPVMDDYSGREAREIDLLFIGTYSRHHRRRAELIEQVAGLGERFNVSLHFQLSKITKLADGALGLVGPLRKYRRPSLVRRLSSPPLFGRDLYEAMSRARIVVNAAVDMAEVDRGNMRCWEALGCGALMLSDAGHYLDGMADGGTIVTYENVDDLVDKAAALLHDEPRRRAIAEAGNRMVRTRYSKERQWQDFLKLL